MCRYFFEGLVTRNSWVHRYNVIPLLEARVWHRISATMYVLASWAHTVVLGRENLE